MGEVVLMRFAVIAIIAACATPAPVAAPPPAKPVVVAAPPKFVAPPVHADSSLFADLPSGGFAVLAGNIYELQHWVQSAFGSAVLDVTDAAGAPSMRTWMTCFESARGVRTAGAIFFTGGHIAVSSVMLGISMADVVRCGKDAGFDVQLDPDNKFVRLAFVFRGQSLSFSELELPDHAIYSHMQVVVGAQVAAPTRAELEAEQAAAAKSSMADAHDLLAAARAVDQQPMWFAVDGKLSPWPAQLAEAHGTLDLRDGFHVVIDAEVIDHAMRDRMVASFASLKQQKLPAAAQTLVDGINLTDDGNTLHVAIDWTQAQVKSIAELASQMVGARRKATGP